MEVGDRIKLLRKQKGVTQQSFAIESGLSLPAIWQFERNASKPNFTSLKKLAIALDVSVDYLVFGKERSEPSKLEVTLKDLKQMLSKVKINELSSGFAAKDNERTRAVPFVGRLPQIKLPVSEDTERVNFPAEWLEDESGYLVQVDGDEMRSEGIIFGCLLAVAPSKRINVNDGDIALVKIGEERHVARISFLGDGKPVAELGRLKGRLVSIEKFEVEGIVTWIGRTPGSNSSSQSL